MKGINPATATTGTEQDRQLLFCGEGWQRNTEQERHTALILCKLAELDEERMQALVKQSQKEEINLPTSAR